MNTSAIIRGPNMRYIRPAVPARPSRATCFDLKGSSQHGGANASGTIMDDERSHLDSGVRRNDAAGVCLRSADGLQFGLWL